MLQSSVGVRVVGGSCLDLDDRLEQRRMASRLIERWASPGLMWGLIDTFLLAMRQDNAYVSTLCVSINISFECLSWLIVWMRRMLPVSVMRCKQARAQLWCLPGLIRMQEASGSSVSSGSCYKCYPDSSKTPSESRWAPQAHECSAAFTLQPGAPLWVRRRRSASVFMWL